MPASRREEDALAQAGTTLIEFLVALALLAILIVSALEAVRSLQRFDRLSDDLQAQAEVRALADHFRSVISDARVHFQENAGEAKRLVFSGESSTLELTSVLDDELVAGGLYALRYSLDRSGALTLERRLIQGSSTMPVVVIDGAQRLTFRYFGPPEQGGEATWQDRWTASDRLPLAIEVSIQFPDSDPRKWPRTIITLAATS